MLDIPILDENGTPVATSWSEAKDTGALSFFAGPDEDCEKCRGRRYITTTLACWRCENPPAPMYGDVAPDLSVALARGFHFYKATEPCPTHPTSRFTTATQRCTDCEHEEAKAAGEERRRLREEQQKREHQEYLAMRREENRLARERRAEAEKAERVLQVITRTTGEPKRSPKTRKRAQQMLAELTPKPKRKRARATPGHSRKSSRVPARGKRRGKANAASGD